MKHLAITLATVGTLQAADFQIDLNAHLNLAVGAASTEEADLAAHAHDPNDEFTLQGVEVNSSARYGEHLSGFVAYNTFLDSHNKIDGELEEAFLKLTELPLGFELRGGRLFNRTTSQNSQHQHSWHFADANLITSRFLGDEGLSTNSVELSYWLPLEHKSLLSVAYGDAITHEHHHEDSEHDHHDEDVEGEGALLADDILSVRVQGIYQHTDFHQYTYGLSYLHGKNSYGKTSSVAGADLSYLWRENGIEPGGKHLRATIEPIFREFDFSNEDGDVTGDASEWGIHTSVGWGFVENWEIGLRFDYLEGVGEPVEALAERHRSSAALSREVTYNDYLSGRIRLQYNHDWSKTNGHEDALWLQCQIDLGKGGEVR